MTALARTGPTICGRTEPLFIGRRSLARSAGSGSTAVIRAWSTDMYAPYPAPSRALAKSVTVKVGCTATRIPAAPRRPRGARDKPPPATQPVREQAAEHRGQQREHEVDHHERQQARLGVRDV